MKATKQTTYSWESATNVSEKETREFANYLLGLIDNKPNKQNLSFEIAPKSTEINTHWEYAKHYCEELVVDGKSGWRLPTNEELNEIYESENDFEKRVYWSSTEDNGGTAWLQSFTDGGQYNYPKNYDTTYVRAIRSSI